MVNMLPTGSISDSKFLVMHILGGFSDGSVLGSLPFMREVWFMFPVLGHLEDKTKTGRCIFLNQY